MVRKQRPGKQEGPFQKKIIQFCFLLYPIATQGLENAGSIFVVLPGGKLLRTKTGLDSVEPQNVSLLSETSSTEINTIGLVHSLLFTLIKWAVSGANLSVSHLEDKISYSWSWNIIGNSG